MDTARWKENMFRWLQDQLDAELRENFHREIFGLNRVDEKTAIAQARAGNPEALRKLYPQFADCINPLKKGRPKRWSREYTPQHTGQTLTSRSAFVPSGAGSTAW